MLILLAIDLLLTVFVVLPKALRAYFSICLPHKMLESLNGTKEHSLLIKIWVLQGFPLGGDSCPLKWYGIECF